MNIKLGKGNLILCGENYLSTYFKKIRSPCKMYMNQPSFMFNRTTAEV